MLPIAAISLAGQVLSGGELERAPEPRRSNGRFQVIEDTGGQFRESDGSLLRALGERASP